jgi:calcium/calmodulin-dependent protein kinase I
MSIYHKGEKITDYYKIEDELGAGSFAIVKYGVHKVTGLEVAIKIINRKEMEEDDEVALRTEVEILSSLDHPNVVKMHEVFDEDEYMFIVLELMTGGELFDRIVEKESYSEKEAADTIRPIVDAIRYCHENGIIHRDLKPENLLYESKDEASVIKISDFGLARFLPSNVFATTACGTPGYVAPEILRGKGYGASVDVWSIGITLYILLCGFPPFYNEDNAQLFEEIKKGEFDFPSPYWDDISDMAKDLISRILKVTPSERIDIDGILSHPWITGEDTPRTELHEVKEQIKKYNAARKLRKATYSIMAANRFKNILTQKDKE